MTVMAAPTASSARRRIRFLVVRKSDSSFSRIPAGKMKPRATAAVAPTNLRGSLMLWSVREHTYTAARIPNVTA